MTRLHLKRHEVGGPVTRHEVCPGGRRAGDTTRGLSGCNYRYPGSGLMTEISYKQKIETRNSPGFVKSRTIRRAHGQYFWPKIEQGAGEISYKQKIDPFFVYIHFSFYP